MNKEFKHVAIYLLLAFGAVVFFDPTPFTEWCKIIVVLIIIALIFIGAEGGSPTAIVAAISVMIIAGAVWGPDSSILKSRIAKGEQAHQIGDASALPAKVNGSTGHVGK